MLSLQLVVLFRRCGLVEGSVTSGGLGELKDCLHSKCALCFLLATQDVNPQLLLQPPCLLFVTMLPATTLYPSGISLPGSCLCCGILSQQ